jgi:hypothetical protein
MTRPIIGFFDVVSQEESFREMNDAEFAQYEINQSAWESEMTAQAELDLAAAAKKAAKAEALAALGLSQEVINLLAD